jgi:integrase
MARVKIPGLSQRGGRWLARFTQKQGDAARYDVTRTFERKSDAEDWLIEQRNRRRFVSAGLPAPAVETAPGTLRQILSDYEAELKSEPHSDGHRRRVGQIAATLCRALGENHPVPLTRADLVRFAAWARTHTETKGDLIARAFVNVRTAHKLAGLLPPEAPAVRFERGGRLQVPHEHVLRFLNAMPLGSPEKTAAEIMFRTAARLTEVLRLKLGDVDLAAGILRIETRKGPKANRVRTVEHPITPDLQKILEAAMLDLPTDKPLIRLRGRAVREPASLRKRLVRASSAARAAVLRDHPRMAAWKPEKIFPTISCLAWMRNHVVTQLVETGTRIETVSRLAGHASVTTTQRFYDKSRGWAERVAAAEKLDQLRLGESHIFHTLTVDSGRKG